MQRQGENDDADIDMDLKQLEAANGQVSKENEKDDVRVSGGGSCGLTAFADQQQGRMPGYGDSLERYETMLPVAWFGKDGWHYDSLDEIRRNRDQGTSLGDTSAVAAAGMDWTDSLERRRPPLGLVSVFTGTNEYNLRLRTLRALARMGAINLLLLVLVVLYAACLTLEFLTLERVQAILMAASPGKTILVAAERHRGVRRFLKTWDGLVQTKHVLLGKTPFYTDAVLWMYFLPIMMLLNANRCRALLTIALVAIYSAWLTAYLMDRLKVLKRVVGVLEVVRRLLRRGKHEVQWVGGHVTDAVNSTLGAVFGLLFSGGGERYASKSRKAMSRAEKFANVSDYYGMPSTLSFAFAQTWYVGVFLSAFVLVPVLLHVVCDTYYPITTLWVMNGMHVTTMAGILLACAVVTVVSLLLSRTNSALDSLEKEEKEIDRRQDEEEQRKREGGRKQDDQYSSIRMQPYKKEEMRTQAAMSTHGFHVRILAGSVAAVFGMYILMSYLFPEFRARDARYMLRRSAQWFEPSAS